MTLEQALGLVQVNQSELAREAGEPVDKFVISKLVLGKVDAENVSYGRIVRIVRALRRLGLPGLQVEDIFPVRDKVEA